MSAGPDVLELEAVGGLASRMRAIASGICLANDLSRNLIVYWPVQEGVLLAPFSAIFNSLPLSARVQIHDSHIQIAHPRTVTVDTDDEALGAALAWPPNRLRSESRFHSSNEAQWLAALRSLSFKQEIREVAGAAWQKALPLGIPVGVHIRTKAPGVTPAAAVVVAMESYPSRIPFVVASDDLAVRSFIEKRFPGRVVAAAAAVGSQSVAETLETAVDFCALAACREIIGVAGSSFSDVVAAWGNRPLRKIILNA